MNGESSCSGPHSHRPGQTGASHSHTVVTLSPEQQLLHFRPRGPRCSDRCKREGGSDDSQDEAVASSKMNDPLFDARGNFRAAIFSSVVLRKNNMSKFIFSYFTFNFQLNVLQIHSPAI